MNEPNYRGPGVYRHYKGGRYEVLGLALREETKAPEGAPDDWKGQEVTVVVYRPLTPGSILEGREEDFWTRELGDFNAEVAREHGMVPRFEMIEEGERYEARRDEYRVALQLLAEEVYGSPTAWTSPRALVAETIRRLPHG